MSLLRKCLHVPEKDLTYQDIDFRTIDLNDDLTYRDRPLRVLDENVRVTRKRAIKFLKIQWTITLRKKLPGNMRMTTGDRKSVV